MMLGPQNHAAAMEGIQAHDALMHRRKRKADAHDHNERLSKRLSLLNLEQGGQKLYVPVENPSAPPPSPAAPRQQRVPFPANVEPGNETMDLDDSKHKVYIYNLDDELSSESEPEDGKLVFLPDIEKHLRANRIPPAVLANKDGELAGMQLVLYSEPSSLTVPQEQDSVRKAIVEARARMREKQRDEMSGTTTAPAPAAPVPAVSPPVRPRGPPRIATDFRAMRAAPPPASPQHDPDAMDLD